MFIMCSYVVSCRSWGIFVTDSEKKRRNVAYISKRDLSIIDSHFNDVEYCKPVHGNVFVEVIYACHFHDV